MCGITGKISLRGTGISLELLRRMAGTLIHRGPDDEGFYTSPHAGLAQRRLAVIDPIPESTAPLSNEDGSIWIVFNGEIYNFPELRSELELLGHKFRTHCDTEIIVHLYEEMGLECLAKLRGMFAFAIWDSRRNRLFAARDRLGKKPFCYTRTADGLIFGSEIKAITADPTVEIAPSFVAIDEYLTWQCVPSPLTAFENIFKLPPAHFLTFDLSGDLQIRRYWSPEFSKKTDLGFSDAAEHLRELLRESVKIRMVADVPLGAFLSGGVDSGAVVALMATQSSAPVKTFSIGFEDEKFNELPVARLVAERYGTDHTEIVVRPNAAEVVPLLVRHYNEPFADSSALPTYYVAKAAREHVTVSLSGDGGDEGFAGYRHYAMLRRFDLFDRLPTHVRGVLQTFRQGLSKATRYDKLAKVDRLLSMIVDELPGRYRTYHSIVKPQERANLYGPALRSFLPDQRCRNDARAQIWSQSIDSVDWMIEHDLRNYLADCLMVKTDIASMANSLEVRCPLLDQNVVEFACQIPTDWKMEKSGGKYILKRAMQTYHPPEILNRPKTGFALPVANWFRGELAETLRDTLLSDISKKRGLFNTQYLSYWIESHKSGARNWSNRLWALMMLELWFREFID